MRTRPFDLGEGHVHVLSEPAELAKLPPALRRGVPPALVEAWRDFPRTFRERARATRQKAFGRWLLACAKRPCALHVYDTEDFGRRALLEVRAPRPALLDFRASDGRTRSFPPSAKLDERPGRLPPALDEVLRTVGGIHQQYGASGILLPPDALRPLPRAWGSGGQVELPRVKLDPAGLRRKIASSLRALRRQLGAAGIDVGHMSDAWLREQAALQAPVLAQAFSEPLPSLKLDEWLAACPGAPTPRQAARLVPFYEDSGDFLCFDPKGNALWIGWESGGVMPFGTVEDALDALFGSLLRGSDFHRTFAPAAH